MATKQVLTKGRLEDRLKVGEVYEIFEHKDNAIIIDGTGVKKVGR